MAEDVAIGRSPSRGQFLEPGSGQSAGWGEQWQVKVLRQKMWGLMGTAARQSDQRRQGV